MTNPIQRLAELVAAAKPPVRYGFAFLASALAFALKPGIDALTGGVISPFIPAFAGVIAAAALAGSGPGIASTCLLTISSAAILRHDGITWMDTLVRGGLFFAEGLLLSAGSARMSRSVREAAGNAEWHRQLVETAAEGIWTRDNGGVIAYANARMAEMLGWPVEQVIGRKAEDFYFPADISVERIRAQSLTTGLKEQFDRRLRRKDGSELWVLACCNVTTGPRGEVTGTLGMMTDITERKSSEHALRRSEERYRSLFEGVLEGVYQSTPAGRILAANPMLLQMLGFTSEADLNDVEISRDLYVDPGIRARLLEQLDRTGSFQNVEYELRTRRGEIITVLENARAIRDEKGAVLYYEGTLTDVSERKRIQEQLLQAQKVEALGRLAGGIAQDFNNALTVIAGHATIALNELTPEHPARQSAEDVLEAAESAMSLTRQLVAFSRRPYAGDPVDPVMNTRETILLVDDEPLVRELSRDMLERQGYRVILATDPLDAERIGRAATFDLLIADTTMHGMTGTELARRLRTVRPGLKVLFISGYAASPLDREDLSGAGSAILEKPFSADSLGRKIRQMLDRPQV